MTPTLVLLTWEMKGLIWFLICMRRPSPRSTMVGKLSSRSVCPVGAVSNTTTEKFIPFTSLRRGRQGVRGVGGPHPAMPPQAEMVHPRAAPYC